MAMKKKFIEVESPVTNETLEVLGTPEDLHNKTIKLDLARKILEGKQSHLNYGQDHYHTKNSNPSRAKRKFNYDVQGSYHKTRRNRESFS